MGRFRSFPPKVKPKSNYRGGVIGKCWYEDDVNPILENELDKDDFREIKEKYDATEER